MKDIKSYHPPGLSLQAGLGHHVDRHPLHHRHGAVQHSESGGEAVFAGQGEIKREPGKEFSGSCFWIISDTSDR